MQRVVEALTGASRIGEIYAAVSKHVPRTKKLLRKLKVELVETSGESYILDLHHAVRSAKLEGPVLVVAADLPFLTAEIVDRVVTAYENCGKPALSAMIPANVVESLGLSPAHKFEINGQSVIPAGVNMIDASRIDEPALDEEALILDDFMLAFNINSPKDLRLAEGFLGKVHSTQPPSGSAIA